MRAFEVYLNGKKLCVTGIGDDGVLSTIVTSVVKRERRDWEDLMLDVGGLISPTEEHVRWTHRKLRTGDEVLIRVLKTSRVDPPRSKYRFDPAQERKNWKRYVRDAAKRLGWKIQTGKPRRKS